MIEFIFIEQTVLLQELHNSEGRLDRGHFLMIVGSHLHQGEDLISAFDLDLTAVCFEGRQ